MGAVTVEPQVMGRYSTVESQDISTSWADRYYVGTIRSLIAGVPHEEQDDSTMIQGGHDTCAQIDAGETWESFAATAQAFDLDWQMHRVAISAAVTAYCPERASDL